MNRHELSQPRNEILNLQFEDERILLPEVPKVPEFNNGKEYWAYQDKLRAQREESAFMSESLIAYVGMPLDLDEEDQEFIEKYEIKEKEDLDLRKIQGVRVRRLS